MQLVHLVMIDIFVVVGLFLFNKKLPVKCCFLCNKIVKICYGPAMYVNEQMHTEQELCSPMSVEL